MIFKIIGNRINTGKTLLPTRTTNEVFVSEGRQVLVLVQPFKAGAGLWTLPDGADADLYNVHGTGEVRWIEPFMSYRNLSPDAFGAVEHFKIKPSSVSDDEWNEVLEAHKIKPSDLSKIKVEMLRRAQSDPDRISSFKTIRGETSYAEESAMYEMVRSGLVLKDCSSYSDGVQVQYFKITTAGAKALEEFGDCV